MKSKIKINNNPTAERRMINYKSTPKGRRIIKKTSRILSQLGSKRPHRTMSLITSRVLMKDQMRRRRITLAVPALTNKTLTKVG